MSKKKWKVYQEGEYKGKPFRTSFSILGSTDDVTNFKNKLEGVVDVYEQNTELSSPEGTSLTVTAGNPIEYIKLSKKGCQTAYISGKHPIVFKEGVSSTEIRDMCLLFEPFIGPNNDMLAFKPTDVVAVPASRIETL